jgi:hypothetical protein
LSSDSKAKSVAKEIEDWDTPLATYAGQLLEDQTMSFWNMPIEGMDWAVRQAFADSLGVLTSGDLPSDDTVQAIFDDWVESCEHMPRIEKASSQIADYSKALEKLKKTLKSSYLADGFIAQNDNLLTRITIGNFDGIKFPVVEFYPLSRSCTWGNLTLVVSVPGREDADGVKYSDYIEDNFDLDQTEGMNSYELGKAEPNAVGFYDGEFVTKQDLSKAEVTSATCHD